MNRRDWQDLKIQAFMNSGTELLAINDGLITDSYLSLAYKTWKWFQNDFINKQCLYCLFETWCSFVPVDWIYPMNVIRSLVVKSKEHG